MPSAKAWSKLDGDGESALNFLLKRGKYSGASTLERDKLKKQFGIRRIAYVVKRVTRDMILNCFRCYDHLAPLAEAITVRNLGYEAPATLGQ